jgi:hypothetical protein
MKNTNKLTNNFTPLDIAENMYLMNSYTELMRSVRRGTACKDVQYVQEDLKLMFIRFTKNELLEYNEQVNMHLAVIERRTEIQKLRNQISNKNIKLQQLLNESK